MRGQGGGVRREKVGPVLRAIRRAGQLEYGQGTQLSDRGREISGSKSASMAIIITKYRAQQSVLTFFDLATPATRISYLVVHVEQSAMQHHQNVFGELLIFERTVNTSYQRWQGDFQRRREVASSGG